MSAHRCDWWCALACASLPDIALDHHVVLLTKPHVDLTRHVEAQWKLSVLNYWSRMHSSKHRLWLGTLMHVIVTLAHMQKCATLATCAMWTLRVRWRAESRWKRYRRAMTPMHSCRAALQSANPAPRISARIRYLRHQTIALPSQPAPSVSRSQEAAAQLGAQEPGASKTPGSALRSCGCMCLHPSLPDCVCAHATQHIAPP